MLPKHDDSALAQQVYGTVHAKLTASIEESAAKQKHIKTAIEVAQKATDLDPNSMEFAHFFASLLFDYMAENEARESALDERKRAPDEESTVDASKETAASNPETSKNQMHLEELVDKDAEDRSVAARVALAKIAKNDKKDSWKGESKQMVEMKAEERKLEEAMEYQRRNLEQTLEYQTMIEEGAQVHQYDRMVQFEAVMANYQNDLQSNNTCDISGIKAGANSGKQLGAEFNNAEPTRGQ